jgi:DNA mismatch endonuclease (patch repair protein)
MMTVEPAADNPAVSKRMSRQRVSDTAIELSVRRALHGAGLRYRKHFPVPGLSRRSIDIAFPGKRLAVFLDGCFWHGCEMHKTIPKTNSDWWRAKIEENRWRDRETTGALTASGWTVLRFWEHDAPADVAEAVVKVWSAHG